MAGGTSALKIIITAVDKSSAQINAVRASLSKLDGGVKTLGKLAIAATAVGAAFAAWKIESAVNSTQELGLAVNKLRRETGLSAEESSRLIFALKHVGLDASDASRAFGILAKKLVGVQDEETGLAEGGKAASQFLADIGIRATDASGQLKPMGELLPQITDAFAGLAASEYKTGLAQALFGRSGRDLLPLLNLGSAGLAALGKEADKLGLTLSADNIEKIRAYTFAHRDFEEALKGLQLQIGLAVMPALTRLATFFTTHQQDIRAFVTQGIDVVRVSLDRLHTALGPVAEAVREALKPFDRKDAVVVFIALLSAVAAGFLAVAAAATVAFIAENAALLGIPAAIAALIAAIVLLVRHWDEVKAHGDAVIFTLLAISTVIVGPVGLVTAIGFLAVRWRQVFSELPGPVQSAAIAVAGAIDAMVNAISGGIQKAAGLIDNFIGKANGVLSFFGKANGVLSFFHLPTAPTAPTIGDLGIPNSNIAGALKGLVGGGGGGFDIFSSIADFFKQAGGAKFPGAAPGAPVPFSADGGGGGGAAKAAEDVLTIAKALEDGVITLWEALALGLNEPQAAVLELTKRIDDLAAGSFRTGVELGKVYLQLGDAGTTLREGAELVRKGTLDFATTTYDTRVQLVALNVLLGQHGLAGQAGVFENALTRLGQQFRQAGETVIDFIARLGKAALDATQSAFGALFNRPTREQATANLRLAELNRRRLLLLQGGRPADDPMIKALDDEIAKVQAANDLRQSEIDIMKARADLADRTLLSDRNQLIQINLLIGAIGQQSALVNQLNGALFFEQLARLAAIGQLDAFTRALAGATATLASGATHGARTAGLLGAGLAGANIAVHVTAPASQQEIIRTVERELNRQLTRASLGGSPPVTGSFVPG